MTRGFVASLAVAGASLVLAACAATSDDTSVATTKRDPCLGVAPAVGTAIVRKEDCAAGRKQVSPSAPASGGAVYDKKLERAGQTGR
jgi:hypothetical protein